jgi:RNA polymerase sigma-70 factor (ECF subfamily)
MQRFEGQRPHAVVPIIAEREWGTNVPPVPPDDQELWERAGRGDRDAFGLLFDRHAEALWNYGYRLTGSWAAAEDLTSQVFLVAWRRMGDMTLVHRSARPWRYTVAANLAREERRRTGRFVRALTRLPRVDAVRAPDIATDVATRIDADRRLRVVLDAIRNLPAAEREAVELCLLGELTTAEAATATGVTETGIRSRISRARARLRLALPALHAEEA